MVWKCLKILHLYMMTCMGVFFLYCMKTGYSPKRAFIFWGAGDIFWVWTLTCFDPAPSDPFFRWSTLTSYSVVVEMEATRILKGKWCRRRRSTIKLFSASKEKRKSKYWIWISSLTSASKASVRLLNGLMCHLSILKRVGLQFVNAKSHQKCHVLN